MVSVSQPLDLILCLDRVPLGEREVPLPCLCGVAYLADVYGVVVSCAVFAFNPCRRTLAST